MEKKKRFMYRHGTAIFGIALFAGAVALLAIAHIPGDSIPMCVFRGWLSVMVLCAVAFVNNELQYAAVNDALDGWRETLDAWRDHSASRYDHTGTYSGSGK